MPSLVVIINKSELGEKKITQPFTTTSTTTRATAASLGKISILVSVIADMVKDPLKKIMKTPKKQEKAKKAAKIPPPAKEMVVEDMDTDGAVADDQAAVPDPELSLKSVDVKKRLIKENAFISQALGLLHMPKHARADDEDDDDLGKKFMNGSFDPDLIDHLMLQSTMSPWKSGNR